MGSVGLFILLSFGVLSRAIHSPFLGISRCQASDVLLSISGGSWHQSLCTMVLYQPTLHVLEGWGETKIGTTKKLIKLSVVLHIASSEKVVF